MAQPEIETELADVVVAAKTEDRPFVPWYVALRPWLFCLAFLLLAEIVTRCYYDTTLCLQTDRFDNFPTPAMENIFVAQMRRDKAYKVVMIGDSTLVGSALLGKEYSVPRYLENSLRGVIPGREVHVWNFSVAGARGSDVLCLLKKAEEGKPDFVIIEANYYLTVMDAQEKRPIAEPWLAYNLPEIPAPLRAYVPKREPKKLFEDTLEWTIENNSRFIGMRQSINSKLFGVQPRVPFSTANPLVMIGVTAGKRAGGLRMAPWRQRIAFSPQMWTLSFLNVFRSDITPENLNGSFFREVLTEMQRAHLPGITYQTPQNPAVTSVCLPVTTFRQRRAVLGSFLSAPGIPNRDYSDFVPDELFNDNDHMSAQGNRMLAEALAAEIAPQIRTIIGVTNHNTTSTKRLNTETQKALSVPVSSASAR